MVQGQEDISEKCNFSHQFQLLIVDSHSCRLVVLPARKPLEQIQFKYKTIQSVFGVKILW